MRLQVSRIVEDVFQHIPLIFSRLFCNFVFEEYVSAFLNFRRLSRSPSGFRNGYYLAIVDGFQHVPFRDVLPCRLRRSGGIYGRPARRPFQIAFQQLSRIADRHRRFQHYGAGEIVSLLAERLAEIFKEVADPCNAASGHASRRKPVDDGSGHAHEAPVYSLIYSRPNSRIANGIVRTVRHVCVVVAVYGGVHTLRSEWDNRIAEYIPKHLSGAFYCTFGDVCARLCEIPDSTRKSLCKSLSCDSSKYAAGNHHRRILGDVGEDVLCTEVACVGDMFNGAREHDGCVLRVQSVIGRFLAGLRDVRLHTVEGGLFPDFLHGFPSAFAVDIVVRDLLLPSVRFLREVLDELLFLCPCVLAHRIVERIESKDADHVRHRRDCRFLDSVGLVERSRVPVHVEETLFREFVRRGLHVVEGVDYRVVIKVVSLLEPFFENFF